MKGVMLEVSREERKRRKQTGLDRWDEMWEGVLHTAPAPSYEHQRIVDELIAFFVPLLKRSQRGSCAQGSTSSATATRTTGFRTLPSSRPPTRESSN